MPDLPLDTLFIVGLLIASFVGRFFQKKSGPGSSSGKNQEDKKGNQKRSTLRDVLRDAWEKANQPEVINPEFTDSIPPPLPLEKETIVAAEEEEFSTDEVFPKALSQPKNANVFRYNSDKSHMNGRHGWIKKELFTSQNSLKRAVILKEILDKPKSLRSS